MKYHNSLLPCILRDAEMYDIVSSRRDTELPPPPHTHSKRCPHYSQNESNTHHTLKTGHERVPGVWQMSLSLLAKDK